MGVTIKDGKVVDDKRIQASIPTLKYLLKNDAKVTVIGYIKGKEIASWEMRPVEDKLIELLETHINWQILERSRFIPMRKNDLEFATQLAAQDISIQDAFANCYRSYVSTVGVVKLIPIYSNSSEFANYPVLRNSIIVRACRELLRFI